MNWTGTLGDEIFYISRITTPDVSGSGGQFSQFSYSVAADNFHNSPILLVMARNVMQLHYL